MSKVKVCDSAFENIKKRVKEIQDELAKDVHDRMMKDMTKSAPLTHEPSYEPSVEYNEDELVGYIMRKTSSINLTYEEVRAVLDAELDFLATKGITEHGGGAKNER